jgi:osmotically-inducible protein OsmY
MRYMMLAGLVSFDVMLSGCAPVIVGGAATTVATAATEERGIGGVWDDTKIKTQILWHYSQEAQGPSGEVDVVVRQGRVLLTGTVDQPQKKIDAVRLAWKVPGVREVVDEIKIGSDTTLSGYAKDSWITTKAKSGLLFDEEIHSVNYNVQTLDGVVYVMGVAPNEQELKRVLDRVSRVAGVKEVVNFVEVGKKREKEPS